MTSNERDSKWSGEIFVKRKYSLVENYRLYLDKFQYAQTSESSSREEDLAVKCETGCTGVAEG